MSNVPQTPSEPPPDNYKYDANTDKVEILWKCLRCGELMPRKEGIHEKCPNCGAPKEEFVLVDED